MEQERRTAQEEEETRRTLTQTQPRVVVAPQPLAIPRQPNRPPNNPDVLVPGIGAQDY